MLLCLHLLCPTLGVRWGARNFTCRVWTSLGLPPGAHFSDIVPTGALPVALGLSPVPRGGVASGRVLAPPRLSCKNLAFLLLEVRLFPPRPGLSQQLPPCGRKGAPRWYALLRACASERRAPEDGQVLAALVWLILLQLRRLNPR